MAHVRSVPRVLSRQIPGQHCVRPVKPGSSQRLLHPPNVWIVLRLLNQNLVLQRANAAQAPQARMVGIARAVLLENSKASLGVRGAATVGRESSPRPSVQLPVPRAQSALQIQTRQPQALRRRAASATLAARGQMAAPARSARPARTKSWLVAAPVQCAMLARTRQMWEPLANKPVCCARLILRALPGRSLPPPVCAMPAPRAPTVAPALSVQQASTSQRLAALHVSTAARAHTRRRLAPFRKEPARHVLRIQSAPLARAFWPTASALLEPLVRTAGHAQHAKPASSRRRPAVPSVPSAMRAPILQRSVRCRRTPARRALPTQTPRQAALSVCAMLDLPGQQANAPLARQASPRATLEMDHAKIADLVNFRRRQALSSATIVLPTPMPKLVPPNACAMPGTRALMKVAQRVRLGRSSRPVGPGTASIVQPERFQQTRRP